MKKLYENPSVEMFSLMTQEQLLNSNLPGISENGFGFGDEGPKTDRNREE